MKIEGMGDQVISVRVSDLRFLGELPAGVEIVRQIKADHQGGAFVYPDEIYLHIRHRFCFRHQPGDALCIESLQDFLYRFQDLAKRELEEQP